MSLIQEALKRHNQEDGQPVTLAPPPLLPPPPLPSPQRRTRFWLLLAMALVVLVACSYIGYRLWPTGHVPKPVATRLLAKPPASANVKGKTKPTPQQPEPAQDRTNPPAPPAPATKLPPANAPVVALPLPRPFAPVVHWPKLNVTGVIGRTGGKMLVFVSGRMLEVGDRIEGVRIVSIAADGVELVYQGATNFVHVGKSTE